MKKEKKELFNEIYLKYDSLIRGALYKMCAPGMAEDLIQEVYMKIWKSLESLNDMNKAKSWIYRICYHQAVDHYRKKKYLTTSLDQNDFNKSDTKDFENLLDHQKIVLLALNQLEPKQRIPLVMNIIEGFSLEEISHITKVSTGTLKSRLFYGRKKLQSFLKDKEINL